LIAAKDYAQVCRELANARPRRYRDREGVREGGGIRMVGLLSAPSEARLARDEIISRFNLRVAAFRSPRSFKARFGMGN
jgi:hypothetical protein